MPAVKGPGLTPSVTPLGLVPPGWADGALHSCPQAAFKRSGVIKGQEMEF